MGKTDVYRGFDEKLTDLSIPRNKSWEAIKVHYKKEWEELLVQVAKAEKEGATSWTGKYTDSTVRNVLMERCRENGFTVFEQIGSKLIMNEETFTISWLGYRPEGRNAKRMRGHEDVEIEKKKEDNDRMKSWESVKKFHMDQHKVIKDDMDKAINSGNIGISVVYDTIDKCRLFAKMFEEDGYYCEIVNVSSSFASILGLSESYTLSIRVV